MLKEHQYKIGDYMTFIKEGHHHNHKVGEVVQIVNIGSPHQLQSSMDHEKWPNCEGWTDLRWVRPSTPEEVARATNSVIETYQIF